MILSKNICSRGSYGLKNCKLELDRAALRASFPKMKRAMFFGIWVYSVSSKKEIDWQSKMLVKMAKILFSSTIDPLLIHFLCPYHERQFKAEDLVPFRILRNATTNVLLNSEKPSWYPWGGDTAHKNMPSFSRCS